MRKILIFFKNFGIPKEILTTLGILSIFMAMIVPLPSFLLDFLLLLSLAISFLILLISVYIKNPTSLTMFPTLILVVTLFRLSLNVASTKAILGHGQDGAESVSKIINAFGDFVVGGDFVLGLITFIILVLINFMVITKGSTRVAEVSARFALDSLPGKQMAIDADLNAGVITDEEATQKRKEVSQTASFYGSMDGASKFVKGDAVAGIIITFINIFAGILIGATKYDMDIAESANVYTLLTIGDGLVSQIPAFILSMAVGIMLTRSNDDSEKNFSLGVLQQLGKEYTTFLIVGVLMLLMTMIPGFPTPPLVILGIFFILTSFFIYRNSTDKKNLLFNYINLKLDNTAFMREVQDVFSAEEEVVQVDKNLQTQEQQAQPQLPESKLNLKILELKVGYNLARSIRDGFIIDKLKGIKKKLIDDIGLIIPKINISDDKNLKPNEYKLYLRGVPIGGFKIEDNKLLAFPGYKSQLLENTIKIIDPNYGLDAYWISPSQKDDAILENYTIIEIPSVIATNLMELIKKNAAEIINRDDVALILDEVKLYYPIVVEEVLQNSSHGVVLQVLQSLLKDDIPINDILTILETIADKPLSHYAISDIVNSIRVKLSRTITNKYAIDGVLNIITFSQVASEEVDNKTISNGQGGFNLTLTLNELEGMIKNVKNSLEKIEKRGIKSYIFMAPTIKVRDELSKIFKQLNINLKVFIYEEMDMSYNFEIQDTISLVEE